MGKKERTDHRERERESIILVVSIKNENNKTL